MRLAELNAEFVGAGGPNVTGPDGAPVPSREGVGLVLDCPCGCGQRLSVLFANPLDGGAPWGSQPLWSRSGDTIDTLTLRPSILVLSGDCRWHGFITNGAVEGC